MADEPPSDSVYELVAAALAVCDRWDADGVDDGAMDHDVYALRRAIEEVGR